MKESDVLYAHLADTCKSSPVIHTIASLEYLGIPSRAGAVQAPKKQSSPHPHWSFFYSDVTSSLPNVPQPPDVVATTYKNEWAKKTLDAYVARHAAYIGFPLLRERTLHAAQCR